MNNGEILKPWYATRDNFVDQLKREIGKEHILYGCEVRTIAKRDDNDDVLFEVISQRDFMYAKVHLTWASRPADDSRWPATQCYKAWQEVYDYVMIPDNENWKK